MAEFVAENKILIRYTGNEAYVNIPDGIEKIQTDAFRNNRNIAAITMPDTITDIGNRAFSGCTRLKSVKLSRQLKTVQGHVFAGCTSLESIDIPGSLISINMCMFLRCTSLKHVQIGEGVRSISAAAFDKCRSLSYIAIPRTVTAINRYAFGKCPHLSKVTFIGCQTRLHNTAFYKCRNGLRFVWPEQKAHRAASESGFAVSDDNTLMGYYGTAEKVVVPSAVQRLGQACFADCFGVKEIDFELPKADFANQCTAIPECAFCRCESLRAVTLPESIKQIGSRAFAGCRNMERLRIPAGVDHISLDIVDDCDSLTEIVLENHRTTYSGMTNAFCTASVRYADEPRVKTMVIFMGLQGSGKSYYFNWHFAGKYEHVNLDKLNTRNKESLLLKSLISEGRDFVVDNTNPRKEDRARYIVPGKAAGYRIIGYFFESKLRDCIRRNDQRTGKAKLPAKAIAATSNKMQLPSRDEGFDELYFVERSNETDMIKMDWSD